ncbi:MAG TPA: nitroreductase family deazaflavin-dependent oxidoreductase [Ktedonobacterales bacterium]
MPATQQTAYPPRGFLAWGFRAPVALYRAGLGWLFGGSLVLINHIGRTSGRPYQTLVELIERDRQTGSVTVVAGYGERTQWYQNLRAHPDTIIQLGNKRIAVRAVFVSPVDGGDLLVRAARKRGRLLVGGLFRAMGYTWDGTEEGLRQLAEESLRFVRFDPLA